MEQTVMEISNPNKGILLTVIIKLGLFLLVLTLSHGSMAQSDLTGTYLFNANNGDSIVYIFDNKVRNGFFSYRKEEFGRLSEMGKYTNGFYKIKGDTLYEYVTYFYSVDSAKRSHAHDDLKMHLYVFDEIEDINVKSGFGFKKENGEMLFHFISDGRTNPFIISKNTGVNILEVAAAPQTTFLVPIRNEFWGKSLDIYLSFYAQNLGNIYWDAIDQQLIVNKYFVETCTKEKLVIANKIHGERTFIRIF